MAIGRMLSKKIIETDAFMDMPLSSQALYMHLVMNADDDGFVSSPKRIMRSINCSEDDKRILLAKGFVLDFESGVIVIKHWKIHNLIRGDRYTETTYLEEKSLLAEKKNRSYTFVEPRKKIVIPVDNQMEPQVSLVKSSIVKSSKVITSVPEIEVVEEKKAKVPFEEILNYLNLKAKKNYRDTETNRKYIRARWKKDKMRIDDFFKCIDNAFAFRMKQGGDMTNMKPSVLFNTKMEERVNGDAYNWSNGDRQPTVNDYLPPR